MSGFSRFLAQMALLMIVALAVVFLPAYAASGTSKPETASAAYSVRLQR
jgi:hypothetical protein